MLDHGSLVTPTDHVYPTCFLIVSQKDKTLGLPACAGQMEYIVLLIPLRADLAATVHSRFKHGPVSWIRLAAYGCQWEMSHIKPLHGNNSEQLEMNTAVFIKSGIWAKLINNERSSNALWICLCKSKWYKWRHVFLHAHTDTHAWLPPAHAQVDTGEVCQHSCGP